MARKSKHGSTDATVKHLTVTVENRVVRGHFDNQPGGYYVTKYRFVGVKAVPHGQNSRYNCRWFKADDRFEPVGRSYYTSDDDMHNERLEEMTKPNGPTTLKTHQQLRSFVDKKDGANVYISKSDLQHTICYRSVSGDGSWFNRLLCALPRLGDKEDREVHRRMRAQVDSDPTNAKYYAQWRLLQWRIRLVILMLFPAFMFFGTLNFIADMLFRATEWAGARIEAIKRRNVAKTVAYRRDLFLKRPMLYFEMTMTEDPMIIDQAAIKNLRKFREELKI